MSLPKKEIKGLCLICQEEHDQEFLQNVYSRVKLPYPKKVRKELKVGQICVVCAMKLEGKL